MNFTKLIAGALLVSGLSACSSNTKFVTHIHEQNDTTFYLAYTDYTKGMMGLTSSFTANVRKCDKHPDKTVTCVEQADLNRLLNAENQQK
jgi:uncharacterized lipoprotein